MSTSTRKREEKDFALLPSDHPPAVFMSPPLPLLLAHSDSVVQSMSHHALPVAFDPGSPCVMPTTRTQ